MSQIIIIIIIFFFFFFFFTEVIKKNLLEKYNIYNRYYEWNKKKNSIYIIFYDNVLGLFEFL